MVVEAHAGIASYYIRTSIRERSEAGAGLETAKILSSDLLLLTRADPLRVLRNSNIRSAQDTHSNHEAVGNTSDSNHNI